MENEKKIPFKLSIVKFLAFLLIAFCLATIFARYLINDEFRSEVDTKILNKEISENDTKFIEINPDSNPQVYAYSKYIAVLSKSVLSIYNQDSIQINKLDVDIITPYADSNDKYLALAEKGGNQIYLIYNTEIKWNKEVEGEIYRVCVNKNGYVTVLLRNSTYSSIVIVYDTEGNELFRTYLAKNYAICAEISDNNKYLAIGQIDYSGTIVKSVVKLISMEIAQANPGESIVNTYESESSKILNNIAFNGKNEAICMFDSYIQKITELSDERIYDITDNDIFIDINLDNSVVTIERENSGLFSYEYQVNLKNTEGKSDNLYILEKEIPKVLYVKNNLICLNLTGEVRIINSSAWLLKRYKTNNEIQKIVMGDNIIGIVYNNKIEIINL